MWHSLGVAWELFCGHQAVKPRKLRAWKTGDLVLLRYLLCRASASSVNRLGMAGLALDIFQAPICTDMIPASHIFLRV